MRWRLPTRRTARRGGPRSRRLPSLTLRTVDVRVRTLGQAAFTTLSVDDSHALPSACFRHVLRLSSSLQIARHHNIMRRLCCFLFMGMDVRGCHRDGSRAQSALPADAAGMLAPDPYPEPLVQPSLSLPSILILMLAAADGEGRGPVKARQAPGYTEITVAPLGRSADDPIEELDTPFAAPQAR